MRSSFPHTVRRAISATSPGRFDSIGLLHGVRAAVEARGRRGVPAPGSFPFLHSLVIKDRSTAVAAAAASFSFSSASASVPTSSSPTSNVNQHQHQSDPDSPDSSSTNRPSVQSLQAKTSKEYYSGFRSIREWREMTELLLQGNDGTRQRQRTIGLAVEATRFWTTQRTPEGVRYGWKLWNRLEMWCSNEEKAGIGRISSDDTAATSNLTTGRYPQLMHLLNAVVDSWRIVWESQQTNQQQRREERDKAVVESPQGLFLRLQSVDPRFVNSRTFTILITAILSTMPPNRQQGHDRQRRPHRQANEQRPASDASSGADEAPVLCEQIFHHMLELSASSSIRSSTNPAADVFPDVIAFTSVLNAWAKSGHPDAPMRALGFWSEWELRLQQRERASANEQHAHFAALLERSAPNVFSYNTLIRALCSTLDRAWIRRAADVVHGMVGSHPHQLHEDGLNSSMHRSAFDAADPAAAGAADIPKPNEATFRLIIGAYAAIRDVNQCLYWLKVMIESGLGHVDAFSKVILSAYLRKQYDAAEATHSLLVEAIESPLVSDVNDVSPHVALTMMRLYADTNRPHLAQAQLEQAEKAMKNTDTSAIQVVNRSYYHNVLYGWINAVASVSASSSSSSQPSSGRSRSHHAAPLVTKRRAAEQTERLLVRMIEVSKRDNERVWAEGRAIDSVLNMWARSVDEFVSDKPEAGDSAAILEGDRGGSNHLADPRPPEERAEALLRMLQSMGPAGKVQVTSSSYFQVMSAWSKSHDASAIDRVMSLLREVEDDPSLVPTRLHYTVAIKACADRYRQEDRAMVEQRLESIFDMAFRQVSAGNDMAAPDLSMMGTLLHAYARLGSGDAAERVLDVMLRSSRRGSTRAALDSVSGPSLTGRPPSKQRTVRGDCSPTIREVNLVLLSWLRSNTDPRAALSKCESLSRRMEGSGLFLDDRSKRILNELREKADRDDERRPESRNRAYR